MTHNQKRYLFSEAVDVDALNWCLEGQSAMLDAQDGKLLLQVTLCPSLHVEDVADWHKGFMDSCHLKNMFPKEA